eukprot:2075714-Amphidinium_carterae.1
MPLKHIFKLLFVRNSVFPLCAPLYGHPLSGNMWGDHLAQKVSHLCTWSQILLPEFPELAHE